MLDLSVFSMPVVFRIETAPDLLVNFGDIPGLLIDLFFLFTTPRDDSISL